MICREIYEDPVLARDGFPYCRGCIVRWAGDEFSWISPRTNERIEGRPVLHADAERSILARDAKLEELRCRPAGSALVAFLESSWQGKPMISPGDCRNLLAELSGSVSPYSELELALRGGMLSLVDGEVLVEACRLDRVSVSKPLLQMEVITTILREAAKRCRTRPLSSLAVECLQGKQRRDDLRAVLSHFRWRCEHSDCLVLASNRSPADRRLVPFQGGVFYRDWEQPDSRELRFSKTSTPEATLFLSLSSSKSRGEAEPIHGARVILEPDGEEVYLFVGSDSASRLPPGGSFWQLCRGAGETARSVPFPDYDGRNFSEAEGGNDDDDGGGRRGSSSEARPGSSQTSVAWNSHIFQQRPEFLPRQLHYQSRRRDLSRSHTAQGEVIEALLSLDRSHRLDMEDYDDDDGEDGGTSDYAVKRRKKNEETISRDT